MKEVATVNSQEGPAFGAAILAMVGVGVYRTVPEACSKLIRVSSHTYPRKASHRKEDDWYSEFRKLYPALKPSFASIGRKLT